MARSILFHEGLAIGITEHASLRAGRFRQQNAGMCQTGRVELHEFAVFQLQSRVQGKRHAVAGQIPRIGCGVEQTSCASGGQKHVARMNGVHLPLMRVERHHALGLGAILGDHQIGHIPFLCEFDAFRHALLPQREEDLMADAVCGVCGSSNWFLAEILGVPAETTLGDVPVFGAGERHAGMFQFDDRCRSLLREQFGRILIDQPIAAFDGVVVMPMPIVVFDIAEAGRDAALCGTGVRAQRLELGNHQNIRFDAGFPQLLHLFAS